MALTRDTGRCYGAGVDAVWNDLPVKASTKIYEGGALAMESVSSVDYARPLSGASEVFLGFANRGQDNSGGAAGDKHVRFRQRGLIELDVTGATADSVKEAVYASDDGTFKLTSTGATQIGKVHQHVSGTICLVLFEGEVVRSI